MELVMNRFLNWRSISARGAPIIRFGLKGKAIGASARQFAIYISAELARANCFTLEKGQSENLGK